MSHLKFRTGPAKPATTAQEFARTINWGIFCVQGAMSAPSSFLRWLRYDAASKDEEELRLLCLAEQDLATAISYLAQVRSSLYAINKLKRARKQKGDTLYCYSYSALPWAERGTTTARRQETGKELIQRALAEAFPPKGNKP